MKQRFRRVLIPLALAFGASLSCMRATASAEGVPLSPVPVAAPTLVVLITVDQLRGDMLDRYATQLRSGYGRLMRGAWFTRAFQDHAITETAPGHASLLSGRFPRSTGIASNSVGVVDPGYRLLSGLPNEIGASPFRFQGTTLFDWIHAKDNRARALSVSAKDRGAILPIGRSRQHVYWYSGNGSFTTSAYYADSLPAWVRDFNARRIPQRYANAEWRLLRDSTAYGEPDSVPFENRGVNVVFPHAFPADSSMAASLIRGTPSMDSVTALFALEGLKQLDLGHGPQTDVVAVSFSATDYVGHAYGPDSREAHDNALRLDQTIGWFLDSLYRLRDSSSIIIALSADHGVQPIPELARQRGEATGDQGQRVSLRQVLVDFRQSLAAAGADSNALLYEGELVGFDRPALARAGLTADSVITAFATAAKRVRGVARVDRPSALRRADFALDPIARRWSHQIPDGSAVDLVITLTRYSVWGNLIPATHGSPYDQDAHVPIIFYGPWANPGRYTEFARTVDVAPTLAAMIGVSPAEKIDGLVLVKAVKR